LIPTPPDPFEEWMRTPVSDGPEDSPFEVRRAQPEEFEKVYDTVDAAFGRKRPRELYDWLYRGNPTGIARRWIVIERESETRVTYSLAAPTTRASGGGGVAHPQASTSVPISATWLCHLLRITQELIISDLPPFKDHIGSRCDLIPRVTPVGVPDRR